MAQVIVFRLEHYWTRVVRVISFVHHIHHHTATTPNGETIITTARPRRTLHKNRKTQSTKMHQIKTQETIKAQEMKQMTRIPSAQMRKEEKPSPTWTSTSSCDAARLVAFAVAESALLDTVADEGYPFHSFASSYSKNREFPFHCLSFVPRPL